MIFNFFEQKIFHFSRFLNKRYFILGVFFSNNATCVMESFIQFSSRTRTAPQLLISSEFLWASYSREYCRTLLSSTIVQTIQYKFSSRLNPTFLRWPATAVLVSQFVEITCSPDIGPTNTCSLPCQIEKQVVGEIYLIHNEMDGTNDNRSEEGKTENFTHRTKSCNRFGILGYLNERPNAWQQ